MAPRGDPFAGIPGRRIFVAVPVSVEVREAIGAICQKLFDCNLLHDEAPSSDNQPGFSKDVCESQVNSELPDAQQ